MSDIVIKLPKETLFEILKQVPPEELESLTQEIKVQTPSLQQQLDRACSDVRPFSIETSSFFSLPPVDLEPTTADDLDQIIAEEAYRKD